MCWGGGVRPVWVLTLGAGTDSLSLYIAFQVGVPSRSGGIAGGVCFYFWSCVGSAVSVSASRYNLSPQELLPLLDPPRRNLGDPHQRPIQVLRSYFFWAQLLCPCYPSRAVGVELELRGGEVGAGVYCFFSPFSLMGVGDLEGDLHGGLRLWAKGTSFISGSGIS